MIDSRFLREPFTKDAGGVPGELIIAADNGAPVNEASCNVIFADGNNERGPRSIAIMGRVSGTAEASAVITLTWYSFHWKSQQFYFSAQMPVVGSAGISSTAGDILVLDHNPMCQKGYIQATGIVANQDLHVLVDAITV